MQNRPHTPCDFSTAARAACALVLLACAGCANPGPPLPPSLKLPEIVSAGSLSAVRVGDSVLLHWTTPSRTTDKLLIAGPVTALICRDPFPPPAKPTPLRPAAVPCSEVTRLPVTPGPSDAVDSLPASLASGPPRPLAYRIELLNAAGRSAGPSPSVLAAAGAAEPPLDHFSARNAKAGVVLEWAHTPASQSGSDTTVELTRTTLASPPAASTPAASQSAAPPAALPAARKSAAPKAPPQLQLAAGSAAAGGVIDRTAQIGYTYRYTAQRVRTLSAPGSQPLQLRSAPSPAVEVAVQDVFPPATPTGLVAVPAFIYPAGQPSPAAAAPRPAIDLSWEPDIEPRVAGYRVYRAGPAGIWQLLTPALVPVAAWRDPAVVAGIAYSYRVSAVSTAGNESAPSPEVTETAPR